MDVKFCCIKLAIQWATQTFARSFSLHHNWKFLHLLVYIVVVIGANVNYIVWNDSFNDGDLGNLMPVIFKETPHNEVTFLEFTDYWTLVTIALQAVYRSVRVEDVGECLWRKHSIYHCQSTGSMSVMLWAVQQGPMICPVLYIGCQASR